ncbi:MAG: acyl-CoA thioesterase [Oscillospiraceae bacterium]|jgi:acyl-CoA hydrolase|nr:acyl-CoA thioesterase [Oscillospiraceae bacterium]
MKTIQDSQTRQVHMIRYQYMNGRRRLFGGALLQWIDEIAGIVATRHTGGEVTTASVDHLEFKAPAFLNDILTLEGRVTYIGRTSMEVLVDTYIEARDGQQTLINRAYLTLVALDGEGRPMPIPPIALETEEERAEWAAGEGRYLARKAGRGR